MNRSASIAAATCALVLAAPAAALHSTEALAKAAQNPLANLISIPFQNNTNFNVGPRDGTQNVLDSQPVIPFELSKDWNLITRTIVPIITQPGFVPGESTTTGLGDIQFTGFASPSNAEGVGAIGQLPMNSSDRLGNDRWGLGPSFVALHLEKGDPWVYGFLVNIVWSVGGGSDPTYNNFLLQPFLNYNLPDGWYLTSSPVITADWKAEASQQWTVPVGGGVGKIVHFGRLPVNLQLQSYYNVVAPDNGPDWSIRFQIQFLLPKCCKRRALATVASAA
ncbi:MAG TPA: transporter [Burkholderiales bacterium]|nr:transporter [Burkholderiales bacterium]